MKPYVICQARTCRAISRRARATTVLAPLDRRGRVAEVERRLADAIRVGVFGDGDQLPGGRSWRRSSASQRSRCGRRWSGSAVPGSWRHQRGRNGGTFVHAPADAAHARLLERLAELSVDDLRDLADHRAAIAGAAGAPRRRPGVRLRPRAARPAPSSSFSPPAPTRNVGRPTRASTSNWRRRRVAAADARGDELQTEAGALVWLANAGAGAERALADHRAVLAAVSARDAGAARDRIVADVETG